MTCRAGDARVLVPELLDSLPVNDPGAIRSRADLRRLDVFMGNSRWVLQRLAAAEQSWGSFLELGAGDGRLCSLIASRWRDKLISGWDFVARPAGLDQRVNWRGGDFLQAGDLGCPDVCSGALILHHFGSDELLRLGEHLRVARRLLFVEPVRHRLPLLLSMFASPFLGRVTRHDMRASIRAGFLPGELGPALGLPGDWKTKETATFRGALRFEAWRI